MDRIVCVVHYPHIEVSSRIVPLDQHKLETLITAKEARTNLGGDNAHPEQCASVPLNLLPEKQGAHVECYKKFTLAISTAKKRNVLQDISNNDSKRVRRSGEGSNHIFGDHCMICKSKNPIKVSGKKQFPHVLQEEEGLVNSAALKHDEQMLILTSGGNLSNRNFRVHRKCHTNYVRVLHKPLPMNTSTDGEESFIAASDFDEVEKCVREEIIGDGKAVTLEHLNIKWQRVTGTE